LNDVIKISYFMCFFLFPNSYLPIIFLFCVLSLMDIIRLLLSSLSPLGWL